MPTPTNASAETPPRRTRGPKRSRARWWAITVAVIVVIITLGAALLARTGRHSDPTAEGSLAPTTRIALSSAGGSSVGEQAPSFVATTTAGASFTFPPGRPAVLFFMAGWCGTCIPEAAALDRVERDLGDRVAILGVDADPSDSLDSLQRFADTVGARYGFVFDGDGTLTQALGVRSLDTTVVVDAAGRIVFRDAAPTSEATLRDALAKAGLT